MQLRTHGSARLRSPSRVGLCGEGGCRPLSPAYLICGVRRAGLISERRGLESVSESVRMYVRYTRSRACSIRANCVSGAPPQRFSGGTLSCSTAFTSCTKRFLVSPARLAELANKRGSCPRFKWQSRRTTWKVAFPATPCGSTRTGEFSRDQAALGGNWPLEGDGSVTLVSRTRVRTVNRALQFNR